MTGAELINKEILYFVSMHNLFGGFGWSGYSRKQRDRVTQEVDAR
jgi:hypothetical protein